jgi:hypothetical protein
MKKFIALLFCLFIALPVNAQYFPPGGSGVPGGGTVTQIVAGNGLTGGTINTTGTVAVANPVSPHVIYASQAGVPAINPASPQAGAAGTAQLQAILNTAPGGPAYTGTGPLEVVIDIPIRIKRCLIYSGTTVRGLGNFSGSTAPAGGVWQDTCTSGIETWNMFQNAHLVSPHGGNIVDQDITIKDLYLNGLKAFGSPGTGGHASAVFNPQGDWVVGLGLFGISNLRLENLYIYDTPTFCIYCGNIDHGVFKNIEVMHPDIVNNPQSAPNGEDGLHFIGPINDILVDGLSGSTGDDFLAFDMVDYNVSNGTLGPVLGSEQTDLNKLYYGDAIRVVAKNLFPNGCAAVIRMLAGAGIFGGPPCSITQVDISSIVGSYYVYFVSFENFFFPAKQFKDISIRNARLNLIGTAPLAQGVKMEQDTLYSNIKFKDITFTNLPQTYNTGQLKLYAGTVDRLEIDGWNIIEDSGNNSAPAIPIVISGGTVQELDIKNSGWQRVNSLALPFVSVTGGTVSRINLNGVAANNINNILSISGGTVTDVNTVGLSHTGAAGQPSINIGSGVTLGRLRSCGSDTVQLQGGSGTVTSKKTDSTEDS